MVRSAQVTNLATKAGLTLQWDFLSPLELALLTRMLAKDVDDPNDQTSAFGTLALASLELKANAKSALLAPTEWATNEVKGDLFLNIGRGCKTWLQSAYTNSGKLDAPITNSRTKTQSNDVPFSEALNQGLQRHQSNSGAQPTLGGILSYAFGKDEIQLYLFNQFLKERGDTAHIAEPTRFACSLGAAFLEVTGSDMLSAFCTLSFGLAAPSALYYFSPSRRFIEEQCTKVYQYLGLGHAVSLDQPTARMGACK